MGHASARVFCCFGCQGEAPVLRCWAGVGGEAAKRVTGTKGDKQRIICQATIHHLKPKQRNNFPASPALSRWAEPLHQQAGVPGLRKPIHAWPRGDYPAWLRYFQAWTAKSLAAAAAVIDLFISCNICRQDQRHLGRMPAVVQPLPEEQMLSWQIISIWEASRQKSKPGSFMNCLSGEEAREGTRGRSGLREKELAPGRQLCAGVSEVQQLRGPADPAQRHLPLLHRGVSGRLVPEGSLRGPETSVRRRAQAAQRLLPSPQPSLCRQRPPTNLAVSQHLSANRR